MGREGWKKVEWWKFCNSKAEKKDEKVFYFCSFFGKKRLMLFSFTNDHLKERRKGCGMMRKKEIESLLRELEESSRGKICKEINEREREREIGPDEGGGMKWGGRILLHFLLTFFSSSSFFLPFPVSLSPPTFYQPLFFSFLQIHHEDTLKQTEYVFT